MIKTNLPLLFIKNHEIFPFTETKLEFSDINFKQTISLAESCFDNCLFIIHQKQTDNLEAKNNINIGIKIDFAKEAQNDKKRYEILTKSLEN